jgi:hypothetical protein
LPRRYHGFLAGRYPIAASQEQDGMISGRLTIEITAVKESEDYEDYAKPLMA